LCGRREEIESRQAAGIPALGAIFPMGVLATLRKLLMPASDNGVTTGSPSKGFIMKRCLAGAVAVLSLTLPAFLASVSAEQPGPAKAPTQTRKGPLKVFILAGQSNMDGQANVSTIDFLGEGRFFILVGKSFAETMLELMGAGK
jgi:hypothetical protein